MDPRELILALATVCQFTHEWDGYHFLHRVARRLYDAKMCRIFEYHADGSCREKPNNLYVTVCRPEVRS